jgi:hypothetical protein
MKPRAIKISKADEMRETRELARCLTSFIENYCKTFRGTTWEELTQRAAARANQGILRSLIKQTPPRNAA